MISGVSGINAQMVTQTQFFKELICEINDQWIFLCMLGLWCFSVTEIKKRLFINWRKVEMSGSGVIWSVRATKRNEVNDKFRFHWVLGLYRKQYHQGFAQAGGGERNLAFQDRLHLKRALCFCAHFLPHPSAHVGDFLKESPPMLRSRIPHIDDKSHHILIGSATRHWVQGSWETEECRPRGKRLLGKG